MVKQILAFESIEEYDLYKEDIEKYQAKWKRYCELLIKDFELIEIPKAIVWTTGENATSIFSRIPIPAYTNKDTIYMTPNVNEWRDFYLSQLDDVDTADDVHIREIKSYFNSLTTDHVFCILAHELTHHIELFPDEFEDERCDSIWFEEGMCEYISQKFTLSPKQFEKTRAIDRKMLLLFKNKYGQHSLDHFGSGSYEDVPLHAIMLNYSRSLSAIQYLVEERHKGDIIKVFNLYHEWNNNGRKQPLTEFFGVSHF